MRRFRLSCTAGVLPVVFVCLAAAAEPAATDTSAVILPPLQVTAPDLVGGAGLVPDAHLRDRPDDNLAEALADLPGVTAVRRSATAAEPVIRGLGWERVATYLGAVPLYGACPGRMDPPAAYLTPGAFGDVRLLRGGGTADLGPGAVGGAIVADADQAPAASFGGFAGAGYAGARDAKRVEAGLQDGDGVFDWRASGNWREGDDYTAPDGTVVPAGLMSAGANLGLGWQPRDGQRFWQSASYVREEDVDFPALPMDNIRTDFFVHNLGWRRTSEDGRLRRLSVTGGYSIVDHFMDNSDKSNLALMAAGTDALTRTWAVHARSETVHGPAVLTLGLDASRLGRDALRRREMAAGAVYVDHLWPDAVQRSAGAMARLETPLDGDRLGLSVEGRLDAARSRADAADDPSLGGLTVREQYVRYYGADAAVTDRDNTLGQAAVALDFAPAAAWQARLRLGASSREPGISELYYAFAPAPGGFQVGDPTLALEKKREAAAELAWRRDDVSVAVAVHAARIDDYVLPTLVDRRDANGDGVLDNIRGFRSIEAELVGGEAAVELRPNGRVRVPLQLAWVRGVNLSDGRDLPEMPPFSGSGEIRFLADVRRAAWLRAGVRFAADQDRVDPVFPEDRTAGFAVWHAGLRISPRAGLTLDLAVENLFDRLYTEHLVREAALATADLSPGDEIPQPGRQAVVSARWEF